LRYIAIILLLSTLLFSEDTLVRLSYGKASNSDLGQIVTAQSNDIVNEFEVLSINTAFMTGESFFNFPFTQYINISFSDFKDDSLKNSYELTMFLKLFYKPEIFKNYVRVGFGEGFSYTTSILRVEYLEAQEEDGKNSKFLNYLDISIDFNIGKLVNQNDLYLGFLIKHRSGIFGLINNVEHGGSNYNCFYIEKRF